MKERRQARATRLSFGWLSAIPDVIVSIIAFTIYRLLLIMSVAWKAPATFEFWCTPHRLTPSLNTVSIFLFGLLILWMLAASINDLVLKRGPHWPALSCRVLMALVLGSYIVILVQGFGGVPCDFDQSFFNGTVQEIQQRHSERWN